MRFMNEHDIADAVVLVRQRPALAEYLPYVEFLRDWKDVVNANSDGWPYWSPAVRAAGKLIEQVEALDRHIRYGDFRHPLKPEVAAFKRALTPIRSFATKHNLKAPEVRA